MLGKKDKKEQTSTSTAINVIGEGTKIVGNISSNGDVRIDGVVEGDIQTTGKCVLGSSGLIKGNIKAKNADLSGTVEGNISISELLLVKTTGKVNGDINTAKIVVENGGEFNGACTMGNAISISGDNKKGNGQSATG